MDGVVGEALGETPRRTASRRMKKEERAGGRGAVGTELVAKREQALRAR